MGIISEASEQLAGLIDLLSLAARIEAGRYEPEVANVDTLELAGSAAERIGDKANAGGRGSPVRVEPGAAGTALYGLAYCALRHGGLEAVELTVDGAEIAVAPIAEGVAPIVLGEDLRDLGAAVGVRVVAAFGGSTEVDGETLRVRLPEAS